MSEDDNLTFADLDGPGPAGDRYRIFGIAVAVVTLLAVLLSTALWIFG